jgi:acetyl esterase/lipase
MEFSAKFSDTYYCKEAEIVVVKFFQSRPPCLLSTLAKICCPVRLIHFDGDIVYTLDEINALETDLKAAGVDAQILSVPGGCHYGSTMGDSKECVVVPSSHPPYR